MSITRGLRNWIFGSVTEAGGGRIAHTTEQIQEMLSREAYGDDSGGAVSDSRALGVAAVWACVRLLSTAVAMLPLALYRRDGERNILEDDMPVHDVLAEKPNSWQSPFEFMQMAMVHLLMRGNFYAEKVVYRGKLTALIPLNSAYMQPKISPNGVLMYLYRAPDGRVVPYKQHEILHIRGLTVDGIAGLSVLQAARRAVNVSAKLEGYSSGMMDNGARPTGVLETDEELNEEAFQRIRQDFEANFVGTANAGRPLILESKLKWRQLSLNAADAQFIDQRKYTRAEVAMFFGVPPHMIGDIERGTSWGSGIETQNLGFLVHTLMPYLVNITQACERDLLLDSERGNFVLKFDTSLLTRADFGARQTGLQIQKRNGVISINEWRKIEGLDPLEEDGADKHTSDQNPVPAGGGSREGRQTAED
ncbi:Phage portal protein [Hyphomicrobium sulfonivorans]|uniref:Phage portal protein n=1 Tax=Hyphomicrobium sulfonivorans TaxID=121290 RepID=A0A109BP45_HYPSL|nr:Phage portal protein [Hyphomicrobium sulfonivorans]